MPADQNSESGNSLDFVKVMLDMVVKNNEAQADALRSIGSIQSDTKDIEQKLSKIENFANVLDAKVANHYDGVNKDLETLKRIARNLESRPPCHGVISTQLTREMEEAHRDLHEKIEMLPSKDKLELLLRENSQNNASLDPSVIANLQLITNKYLWIVFGVLLFGLLYFAGMNHFQMGDMEVKLSGQREELQKAIEKTEELVRNLEEETGEEE